MTDEDVVAVAQAIAHPLRLAIIRELRQGAPLSPSALARTLAEPVANVYYHFGVLSKAEILELAQTARRRGVVEHFYTLGGPNAGKLLAALDALD